MNIATYITACILYVTGYRFSKYHRHNNTLLYKLLNTTRANQIAYKLAKIKGNDNDLYSID